MTLRLYALCGLPFGGKSTFASELSKRTGAVLVRLDAINGEFGVGLDSSPISTFEWQRTYDEAYRRIAHHLAAGDSVIFDHGNFSRAERDQVRAIGSRVGVPVQFIHVPITVEEARRRRLANRQTRIRSDIRDEDFEQALMLFEAPDAERDVLDLDDFEGFHHR